MNISKADYDELVRLRGLGYELVQNSINGNKMAWNPGRGIGIKPNFFNRVIPRQGVIDISAAIAEYEREHKEDAKPDDASQWPDWKKRAALSNYEFGKEDA